MFLEIPVFLKLRALSVASWIAPVFLAQKRTQTLAKKKAQNRARKVS
jgi:hypothetical protein